MIFHQIRKEKTTFFVPVLFWIQTILKKIDQKIPFGGQIGYENSCMFLFAYSKIFRFHAILHDAAGSVKSTTHKGPGYC